MIKPECPLIPTKDGRKNRNWTLRKIWMETIVGGRGEWATTRRVKSKLISSKEENAEDHVKLRYDRMVLNSQIVLKKPKKQNEKESETKKVVNGLE